MRTLAWGLLLLACTSAPVVEPVDAHLGAMPDATSAADAWAVDGAIEPRDAAVDDADVTTPRACDDAPSGWIFCEDFETETFDAWDDYDGNPAPDDVIVVEPGPSGRAGNHVARLRVPEGRGGADLVKVLPVSARELYARWHVRWEPGYDFGAPNHGSGLHAGSRDLLGRSGNRPDGDDWASAWIEPVMIDGVPRLNAYAYYAGMYMDCVDPSGSCWGDHFPCMVGDAYCTSAEHRPRGALPVALTTDRWYCIEERVDLGAPSADASSASGTLDFWIDGVAAGPFEELWLRSSEELEVNILWLSLFHHEEHSVEGIMLDDVAVSTERVGCF